MKSRILIIKRSNLEFDVRCQRIATFLGSDYDITLLGTDVCPNLNVKQLKITDYYHAKLNVPQRALRKFRREILLRNLQEKSFDYRFSKDAWIFETIKYLNTNQFDLIVACDIDAIAAVLSSKNRAKVIGDMHEHAPTELANLPGWTEKVGKYRKWQCQTFLPGVTELFTVSNSLARLFEEEFKLSPVNVLRNTAPFRPRSKNSSFNAPRKFIHHGIAAEIRGLEVHAFLAAALGMDYSISMLLKPVEFEFYRYLKKLDRQIRNFHILEPVNPEKMLDEIAKYEAGIYLLKPLTSQLEVTLPNKFFEYIQARLPIFSGGLKEMDDLVTQYGIGINLGTFDPLEAAKIIKEKDSMDWSLVHENLDFTAKELSAENEFKKISKKVSELLSA